jgi:cation diffusion facilitator CzcD-associated flavoprotein CzcO
MYEVEDYRVMERLRRRVDDIVKDPKTAEALKPYYRFLCKRPLSNDEYLPAFNEPHVTLVDVASAQGVERITEKGLIANGKEYEVDCIIYASGFESGADPKRRMGINTIEGRNGESLYDHWKGGYKTLHGMMSHGFPNQFYTGYTQAGFSANVTEMYDQQCIHIAHVIARALRDDITTVEPSKEAEAAWCKTITDNAVDTSRFLRECTPGYFNAEGAENATGFLGGVAYGPGFHAFDKLLQDWRNHGDMAGMMIGK